jgi:hypothetical protein
MDMGYRMRDEEFDKLWDRFDTDGYKAVTSDKFLKILTNESIGEESMPLTSRDEQTSSSPRPTNIRSSYSDTDLRTPRVHSKDFYSK